MSIEEPSVLGVDGARGGWIAARLSLTTGQLSISFHGSIEPLIAGLSNDAHPDVVLAVDMPIGLSATGHRPADRLARERLRQRRSTFFPTPIRAVLSFEEYADANAHSKLVAGSGLSKQAWNLIPKIAEIDTFWSASIADRLVEAHPETSFAEMNGEPILTKKATEEGRRERVDLLSTALSPSVVDIVNSAPSRYVVDTVDALALAWTARRTFQGDAIQLGGELDEAGRPMRLTI